MFSVVIADDEMLMRKAIETFVPWTSLDCTLIAVCKDGKETIEALERYAPDILICDISMPYFSGIDVSRYVSQHKLATQVVLLTAYADFSYAQQALHYGVSDYVVKNGALENIQEAIRKCIERINKISRTPKSSEIPLFLRSLVHGTLYRQDELDAFVVDHALFRNYYTLMTIERQGVEIVSDDEQQDLNVRLSSLLVSSFDKESVKTTQFSIGKDKLCLFIPDSSIDCMVKVAEAFLQVVGNLLHMTCRVGISNAAKELASVHELYDQTLRAISVGFYEEGKNLFLVPTVEKRDDGPSSALVIPAFEQAFRFQDTETMEVLLASYFLEIREKRVNVSEVRQMGGLMLACCRKRLEPYDSTSLSDSLERQLLSAPTCSEFERCLRDIVALTFSLLKEYEQDRYDPVLAAKRFIEIHYMENISLATIAEAVHVNDSYLSRVFKQKTGTTITTAVNQKKVDVACALLEHEDLKTYEVAERVGFEDAAYFSNIFRKHTGLSPSQYRAKARKGQ